MRFGKAWLVKSGYGGVRHAMDFVLCLCPFYHRKLFEELRRITVERPDCFSLRDPFAGNGDWFLDKIFDVKPNQVLIALANLLSVAVENINPVFGGDTRKFRINRYRLVFGVVFSAFADENFINQILIPLKFFGRCVGAFGLWLKSRWRWRHRQCFCFHFVWLWRLTRW